MIDRRGFVTTACRAALASLIPPALGVGHRLERIGLQLYTVRRELERDFDGTLARVAEIGYREVEFAGYFDRSPQQVRASLDRHRLAAPAAHVPLDALRGDWSRTLADAHVVGHRYVVVAWLPPESRSTLDAYRRFAELFNRAGEEAAKTGVQFAYHNHDFEFAPLEGRVPYDVLLGQTDHKLVQLEMDLYWIVKGGQDPLTYFARFPGRFPMVHVKDSMGPPAHNMADVGAGTIDWKRIFAREDQAGIRHFFVEHDEPRDAFASIGASYEYLRRLEF